MSIKILPGHRGQKIVYRDRRRFNWLAAGRRWRKTSLAMSLSVLAAVETGGTYIWGSPKYDQARIAMDMTRHAARDEIGRHVDFNVSRMTADFSNGGRIVFRSMDQPDNVRGWSANGIVIDEAAYTNGAAYYEVLRPMLLDTGGWLWAIFTPNGRNWVWDEWVDAQDRDDSATFQSPTVGVKVVDGELVRDPHPLENPDIPFDEIKNLFRSLSSRVFQQEIMADFIEATGGVFRDVRMAVSSEVATDQAIPGHEYTIGVDWGRSHDYTAFVVFDKTDDAVVYIDRFTNVDYQTQTRRLSTLVDRFQPFVVSAERNAMGGPLVEQLQSDGLPVVGFDTTQTSKEVIIRQLENAFEKRAIRLLDDDVLVGELLAYEQQRLPAGKYKFGAPSGKHDDAVIALALAYHAGVDTFYFWS